jgi:ABC-type lipoprotein export system ATPase subunit
MNKPPGNNGPALIVAREVGKTFRAGGKPVEVLRGLNFTVEAGGFVAVRGASGAGKSTLLHLLGGLDAPTAGDILFEGTRLGSMSGSSLADLRNRKVGFVFQAYHLLPELDALENVCLPARMARMSGHEADQRSRDLLARVGLAERLHHRPRQLSGGEQQRVAIARALVNQPALILADEPTGNLDSHTGSEIIDLLCRLRVEHAMTLIIATHDAEIAAQAQRAVHLVDGLIVE